MDLLYPNPVGQVQSNSSAADVGPEELFEAAKKGG